MRDVLFSTLSGQGGDVGEIILNRPKALNALTREMCEKIKIQLSLWEKDFSIKAVVIRGEGDRAFCAGGDIRQIYANGLERIEDSQQFFRIEYQMNKAIFNFKKPYIALLDGITMGGGVGVSLHGSHPVATERLIFSMPETGIGFFPDVGGGYFLSRCRSSIGLYLGLTGDRICAAEAFSLGLVSQVVDHEKQTALVKAICDTPFCFKDHAEVTKIIESFSVSTKTEIALGREKILNDLFSQPSVETIVMSLSDSDLPEDIALRKALLKKSPMSLKVAFEQIRRARSMTFDEVMAMEFNLACHFLRDNDFYEGIRAVVVDKDQQPRWQPGALDQVSGERVEAYFESDEVFSLSRS